MEYLALLVGDESKLIPPGTPEFFDEVEAYNMFAEAAGPAIKAGDPLERAATARSIRRSDSGEPLVTNGPFTETTEVFGGYYVLDVESLDEVVDLAKQIPWARRGLVEVRPIVVLNTNDTSSGEGRRYLAAIFSTEKEPADTPGTREWDESAEAHGRFMEKQAKSIMGGLALNTSATATTVTLQDGTPLVTDGPYAETTEVVGGFYLLNTGSTDEAVEVAKDIPTSLGGGIEVRPIMEIPQ